MATPHVTGIAALAIASGAVSKHWTPASLTSHLEHTARDLGRKGYDSDYGYGLVNGGEETG